MSGNPERGYGFRTPAATAGVGGWPAVLHPDVLRSQPVDDLLTWRAKSVHSTDDFAEWDQVEFQVDMSL